MRYWLMKSEPDVFSIDDLMQKKITHWDGVRNYQARNMMRDDMKIGDKIFFYHSNATPPGIAGIAEVVNEAYPDHTALDKNSEYHDPKATKENPRWFMIDVKFVEKFSKIISLDDLRKHKSLSNMRVVQKGNRLSITPVTKEEWEIILKLK